jgi:hypothetical protein
MPKTKISEYSTTNSNNTDIESINIDEGCAPSGINNAIRELMVHLKEFQTGSSGDPLTVAGGFVASGGFTSNTMTVTGILTASGGAIMSSTNTLSGSNIISGNINSSGTTNTFSGGNILSGTNTISGSAIISGNINSSGTNTFSGTQVISGGSTFSGAAKGSLVTDNDGSFDMTAGNNFTCTPTGTITLTFTNITSGQSGNILLVNGSNYTVSAHANTKVGTGVLTALSATGTYWVSYFSNGTNVYISATGALS